MLHLNDIFLSYFVLCFRARLFIDTLWSPAGKGLISWLSFVMSHCEVVIQGQMWCLIVSIPDLSPLSYFYVFPRDNIRKLFYSMHNPVFEHSDTLSFALLDCIILHINGKQFMCSVFTFVQYITYTAITDLKRANGLVNRCILLINWVSLCPFCQQ